jgi:hypothetical protein
MITFNGLKVKRVFFEDVKQWLLKRHYAKRIPCVKYAFGLFRESEIIGICTFGVPASPSLCVGICGERFKDMVLELNRLCIEDGQEKNTASFFVSRCLSYLRGGGSIVVSYADTKQGHVGYIYQACNFLYTGLSAKRSDPKTENNKHSRHNSNRICDGAEKEDRPQKHRYVYFCGRSSFVKLFKENLKYPVLPYPKGETKRYDASASITKQYEMFV